MAGQPTADRVAAWAEELTAVARRIGRHFALSEPRGRAARYARGLLNRGHLPPASMVYSAVDALGVRGRQVQPLGLAIVLTAVEGLSA
jgi:hypothetical protein